MTHKDIYTKFMIEYDKANVTSSYPSLTEYEVATILDKAYLALIWQKITGNNIRRSSFEADTKSISDIQPLVVTQKLPLYIDTKRQAKNVVSAELPNDYLDFVQLSLSKTMDPFGSTRINTVNVPVKLVSHDTFTKFLVTPYNIPWVKNPVCCIDYSHLNIAYDITDELNVSTSSTNKDYANFIYVKTPVSFVSSLLQIQDETGGSGSGSSSSGDNNGNQGGSGLNENNPGGSNVDHNQGGSQSGGQGDNQGGNQGGDNTGGNTGDNTGDNTGGSEGGDNPGDNTGGNTGENPGGNTGDDPGDDPGSGSGGDNTGDNTGGDNLGGDNPSTQPTANTLEARFDFRSPANLSPAQSFNNESEITVDGVTFDNNYVTLTVDRSALSSLSNMINSNAHGAGNIALLYTPLSTMTISAPEGYEIIEIDFGSSLFGYYDGASGPEAVQLTLVDGTVKNYDSHNNTFLGYKTGTNSNWLAIPESGVNSVTFKCFSGYTSIFSGVLVKCMKFTQLYDDPHFAVADAAKPKMADLGLSVKWARWNIGSNSIYDLGFTCKWGSTTEDGDDHRSDTPSDIAGTQYDIATATWSDSDWRIPNLVLIYELFRQCRVDFTLICDPLTKDIHKCYRLTGSTGESIYIPCDTGTVYWLSNNNTTDTYFNETSGEAEYIYANRMECVATPSGTDWENITHTVMSTTDQASKLWKSYVRPICS